jgi:uncharacterized membrane protein YhaH (DUF805 family)
MGNFSIVNWLVFIAFFAIWVVPGVKILQKAGYSGWWVLIGLIPVGNIIGLWIFAFSDWPNVPRQS